MRRFLFAFICSLILLTGRSASAQVLYGSAVGKVEDQSGEAVPSATVTLVNRAMDQTRETKTGTDGRYSIVNLLPGNYELNVESPGFRKFIQTGVEITINTVNRLDVKLEIGLVTEQITVSGSATMLQTDTSDVHVELDAKAVTNLPLG